jgi:hypothetical protein
VCIVIDRQKRRKRIKLLQSKLELFEELTDTSGINEIQKKQTVIDMTEFKRLRRIDRSENDVLYFM